MIEFIYYLFFWLVTIQVLIFAFINVSSPKGFRATLVRYINTNKYIKQFLRYHLWLCMVAGIFFYDSYKTQKIFQNQRGNIKLAAQGQTAIQMRRGFLSYTIMKVQRNQYITLMLIYTSIVLNIYLGLLHHMYTKRQKYYRCDQKICNQKQTDLQKRTQVTPQGFPGGFQVK